MIYEHAAYENGGSLPSDLAIRLAPLLFGTPPSRLRRFVGASHAGALVGYSTVTAELSTWQASEFLNMDCLFIRDHARGHGLGKLSIAVIKGEAAAHGFTATDENQRVNHRDVAGPVEGSAYGRSHERQANFSERMLGCRGSIPPISKTRSTVIILAAAVLAVAGLAQVLLRIAEGEGEPGDIFVLVLGAIQFICGLAAFIYYGRRRYLQKFALDKSQDDSPES